PQCRDGRRVDLTAGTGRADNSLFLFIGGGFPEVRPESADIDGGAYDAEDEGQHQDKEYHIREGRGHGGSCSGQICTISYRIVNGKRVAERGGGLSATLYLRTRGESAAGARWRGRGNYAAREYCTIRGSRVRAELM